MFKPSPERLRRVRSSGIGYALVWLPVAALAMYMKWLMLNQMGYTVVARSLGVDVSSISRLIRASLYVEDFVIGFLMVPAAIILLVRFLPRVLRVVAVLTLSLASLIFLFVDLLTYSNVGRFMSPSLASDGLEWVVKNPSYLATYMSAPSLIKFGGLAAMVLVFGWLALRLDPPIQLKTGAGHGSDYWSWAAGGTIALSTLALWLGMSLSAHHSPSVLRQTVSTGFGLDQPKRKTNLGSPEQVRRVYRELANLPPYRRSEKFYGSLSDYDVVFFVFETGPAEVFDFYGDSLKEFPNIRRLLPGSLVATEHYSTYPYTYAALFSIFSGLYPTGSSIPLSGARLPGVPFGQLADKGYQTAVYSPRQSQFTSDKSMFSSLGFDHYVLGTTTQGHQIDPTKSLAVAQDEATLAKMKEDMTVWIQNGQRYAAVFLPQTSHGPWPEIDRPGADLRDRGRAVLSREDAMLGELLDLLARNGRLQHTLIVVTADHGLRTREEDPTLPSGKIDDISFRVPLLFYAPQAFSAGDSTAWTTSHVDIAPTLLDLLGVPADRELFQGLPLWDERLAHSRIFFLASGYLGADGLHDDTGFYMHNDFLGADYAAAQLRFSDKDSISAESPRAKAGRSALEELQALQERWLDLATAKGARDK